MKIHSAVFAPLLAATLLTGSALPARAQATPASGYVPTDMPVNVPAATAKTPALTGTAGTVKYKANAPGAGVGVKLKATLSNPGTKGAKNVTAKVYLSNSSKFDSTATKFDAVNVVNYNGSGTLGKGTTLPVTFKRSFSKAIAKGLQGKYLIVILAASNVDPATVAPVVVGPLPAF